MGRKKSAILISFIVVALLLYIWIPMLFNDDSIGVAVGVNEFNQIRKSFSNAGAINSDDLVLTRMDGNERLMSLNFSHPERRGFDNSFFALFDSKKQENISSVSYEDTVIQLYKSQFIGYFKKNLFIIIDNNGTVFGVDFKSVRNPVITKIHELNIKKNEIQDIVLLDDTLYIMTRTYSSDYNEIMLTDGKIVSIKFNNNLTKGEINEISLNEDTIPVKFVLIGDGSIGYTTIDSFSVDSSYIQLYSTGEDYNYINNLTSVDGVPRLLDFDTYKINLFTGDSIAIDSSNVTLSKSLFTSKVSMDNSKDASSIIGIPVFINKGLNSVLFSSEEVGSTIHYKLPERKSLLYSIDNNSLDKNYGKYDMDYINIYPANHSDYICFINTNLGTIAVSSDGEYTRLTNRGIGYLFNDKLFYQLDNSIVYTKAE